jgi:hypothetical protein
LSYQESFNFACQRQHLVQDVAVVNPVIEEESLRVCEFLLGLELLPAHVHDNTRPPGGRKRDVIVRTIKGPSGESLWADRRRDGARFR